MKHSWRQIKNVCSSVFVAFMRQTFGPTSHSPARVPALYDMNGHQYALFSLVGGSSFEPGMKLRSGVKTLVRQKRYVAVALPQ